jgi:hypothetical protein
MHQFRRSSKLAVGPERLITKPNFLLLRSGPFCCSHPVLIHYDRGYAGFRQPAFSETHFGMYPFNNAMPRGVIL